MINIKNLNKTFKIDGRSIQAINNVSLEIQKGAIYGIIGYSGAGKSTLLRCINRLEEADSGEIIVDGINLTKIQNRQLRDEKKKIGMIFQHFNLLEQRTVADNIAFPMEINNYPKDEIKKRVEELLDYVDLVDKKNSYPSQLSGGQKQRVAIARAISTRPKVLLSDEGTSALDPRTTKSILDLLRQINKDLGITIVMVTHQMEVVKDICKKVAIMENGQVIEENTVENIFTKPKSKTARLFISSLQGEMQEEIIDASDFKGQVVRLSFLGDVAKEPIVSEMVRKFNVDVNILSGNINKLQESKVGHLIVELLGDKAEIKAALKYLEDNCKIKAEVER